MCDWILFLAVYQDYMVYSDIKLCHIYLWNWGGPCYCYVISQLWHTSHLSSKLCDIMTVGCPPDWGGPCRRPCDGDSKTCRPVPRSGVGRVPQPWLHQVCGCLWHPGGPYCPERDPPVQGGWETIISLWCNEQHCDGSGHCCFMKIIIA